MKITQKPVEKIPNEKKQQNLNCWESLVNGILRPPRAKYNEIQLGTKVFMLNQQTFTRTEHTVLHQDKHKLSLSVFNPQYKAQFNPIILYLHGNSSSKLQCINVLKHLPIGFSLASFDFIGCGTNYEADTISLGYRQSHQVKTATEYLTSEGYEVILWGRSMGAASALMYGKAKVIVADSSFKCLKSLCKQIAKSGAPKYIPNCLISCFFPCVFYKLKKDILEKGNYDMEEINIKQAIKNINLNTSLIFITGDEDLLVHHRNSQKLYDMFAGRYKHIQIFKGNHNSKRPDRIYQSVMKMVKQQFYRSHQPIIQGSTDIKIKTK